MEYIRDVLMQLLPRAARTGAGTKEDFQSKARGEMRMEKIKSKPLDNHMGFKTPGELMRRESLLKACL